MNRPKVAHQSSTKSVHQVKKRGRLAKSFLIAAALFLLASVLVSPGFSPSSAASKAGPTEFNSLFAPSDGTITIKSGNYIGITTADTTETAKFTKQVFSSSDCTSGGGSIDTITGVDSTTGYSFTLGTGSSVQITIPDSGIYFAHVSEQNGPFVGFQVADNSYQTSINSPGDGHQACIQGFSGPGERTYFAQFYAGIQFFDSCGTERYSFRPGETMTIKVTGGITHNAEAMRLQAAGGGVNECTFLPIGPSFTTVHVDADPFFYDFTLPASDSDIYPACASSGTTTILGQWRVVTYDVPGCGCNRNDVKFTLANDAPLPSCTLTCPSDMVVSNDPGTCGAVVNYTTPTAPNPATVSCDHPSGSTFPVGATLVTCTSSAGPSCSFNVTVNDAENPTITAPPGFTVGTDPNSCVATGVSLGSPMTGDNCMVSSVTNNAPSQFPLGSTTVTWTVTDNHGHSASAAQVITVVDNTAPTITLNGQMIQLWPPNHQYETVRVSDLVTTASDNCDATLGLSSVYISQVTSDEVQNGKGDGNTLNDIVIAADCKSVQLRAEREGSGNGRVYTITFKVRDASGNTATATAKVTVPKSENGTPAIDDGPHYLVAGTCP